MDYFLFFSLLRDALWRTGKSFPLELSLYETEKLFLLAEKQAVSGLVVDALIRHDVKMPQEWVFEAVGLVEQIKQQNKIINNGIVNFIELMSRCDINYLIVKGQVVASYYVNPLLRQSGDVDFYCDSRSFPLAQITIQNEWGIKPERGNSDRHVHFDYQEVTYEGHFSLTSFYSKRCNVYWQKLLDSDSGSTINIDGHQTQTLSPTLHSLFVFIHLYSHLIALGVGLRQFCDLAVMLHFLRDEINMDAFHRHLEVLGLCKAYRACGSILVDYLGLPEDDIGFALNEDNRKYGRIIMDVVMYRGNMGHYNKRNGFRGWKHKLEATGIKLSHFMKFMLLAPRYSCGWLWYEVIRNIK